MTQRDQRLTALLGPTNTGKTYFALERMLAHASGIMGFPLRLLARENYERAAKIKGRQHVALVTGEEKIIPSQARYFFCTVESMPLDKQVSFLAVDEIQLMNDPERGHIFTDRLLHARGMRETMFLGSMSARGLIQQLQPGMEMIERPRFSTLTHSGHKKLTRLPSRSAIVAFSIAEVYEIAELMRRQRGGAAIVLGALSPRARNAQVALYEAGEVDHLVATDAIGMGLNLDIHHVAFASLRKFDGRNYRSLTKSEIAQIAGRAGRHLRDGTFGTTGEAGEIDIETAKAIEEHKIEPLTHAFWRESDLDFRSGFQLLRSLERRTPSPLLILQKKGEDHRALAEMLRFLEIRKLAHGKEATQKLWEVCQIPDFSKLLNDGHIKLLHRLYLLLLKGPLPPDWVKNQIEALDRIQGDIDVLMQRLAQIRTWSFISHRRDWLTDPAELQAMAGKIEDDLSDALHETLTHRFIDKRRTVLTRQLKEGAELTGYITPDHEVMVEGHLAGRLRAWQFQPEETSLVADKRLLIHAAGRMLRPTIRQKIRALLSGCEPQPKLSEDLHIEWDGAPIAQLQPGATPLRPEVRLQQADLLEAAERDAVLAHLRLWLQSELQKQLHPLFLLGEAKLPNRARGLSYRLLEQMGAIDRNAAQPQLDSLDRIARQTLVELGVRFGQVTIWLGGLEGEERRALMGGLYRLFHGTNERDATLLQYYHLARGKRLIGGKFFSFSRLEYVAKSLFKAIKRKEAWLGPDLAKKLRIPEDTIRPLAIMLHLRLTPRNDRVYLRFPDKRMPEAKEVPADSPFAILADLPSKKIDR